MNIKNFAKVVAFAATLGFVTSSHASLVLTLDAGAGSPLTIGDGDATDINTAANAITWIGALGGWTFNVTTGISNAPGVPGDAASIDLNTISMYTGTGIGTLVINVSDSGWTTPVGNLTAVTNVGGTLDAGGGGSFASFFNGGVIAQLGPYSGGAQGSAFSGSGSASVNAAAGYGLAEIAVLTQNGRGAAPISFDLHTTVPEPGVLALLGLGLLGIGVAQRRRSLLHRLA